MIRDDKRDFEREGNGEENPPLIYGKKRIYFEIGVVGTQSHNDTLPMYSLTVLISSTSESSIMNESS